MKQVKLREETYEKLESRRREGESDTDLVERLLANSTTDWRGGFVTLSDSETEELQQILESR